jgi:hypothetical protein
MKNNVVSLGFSAILWSFSVYQVGLIGVRIYQGDATDTPLIGRLLQPGSGLEFYAAIALLAGFLFVLAELFRLWLKVRREASAAEMYASGGMMNREKIRPGTMARARADLHEASRRNGAESLSDVLGAASAIDTAELESNFAFARALTWALPSLGFMGAALGLAQSIGGFSESLKANDAGTLVASLAQQVIPGLAGSFAITVAALGAATVAHLCATSVAAWGHMIVGSIDATGVEAMARMTSSFRAPAAPVDTRKMEELLTAAVAELRSIVGGIAGMQRVEAAAQELEGAAGSLNRAAEVLAASADRPYHITIDRNPRADSGGRR